MSDLSAGLWNPKYAHNVGGAFRACAAFGASRLYVAGNRFDADMLKRLPREERMRVYKEEVELVRDDRFFDLLAPGVTPVAVEVLPSAEPLTYFQHPENAAYVFGPEDGSLPPAVLRLCHRFVIIPAEHCLNLASAVSCVLMHRRIQRQERGLEPVFPAWATMFEERG